MTANGSAFLCYAIIIHVQKLMQVIKSNTTDFSKNTETQLENTKENTKRITKINWD